MKKLALALVFGMLSVGAVSAQTNQKTKVKTDAKETKIKAENNGKAAMAKPQDGERKPHKTPEERASMRTAKMVKELNLTDDQAMRIKNINLAKAQQMDAMHAQHAEDRQARHDQMREMKQNWENELKAVLSADQFKKYQSMQAERKAKMQEKHKGMKGKHMGHDKK